MSWLSVLIGVLLGGPFWWLAARTARSPKPSFWSEYAKVLAVLAIPAAGWLAYKACTATGTWWSSPPAAALIAAIVGSIAPLTAFIASWAKIQMDAQRQSHEIAQAQAKQAHDIEKSQAEQSHAITGDYLAKALDAGLPLATRHQLLRFLATSATDKTRLQSWAKAELRRIDPMYEQYTKDVQAAHEAIASAADVRQLKLAEAKLKALSTRAESTRGKPPRPDVTPAALRAGIFTSGSDLGELNLPGANLDGATMYQVRMAGSNLEGASMKECQIWSADLKLCNFNDADLSGASMGSSDCRGASFVNANLAGARLQGTRLEGADLTGATLDAEAVRAVYDPRTKWPANFDPEASGCVFVEAVEDPEAEPE